MNSSKTANLLMVAHNYESQGKTIIIFKPSIDTRSSKGYIESRVGIKHICIDINEKVDIYKYIMDNIEPYSAILIDECQFLTKKQVLELTEIADEMNIPIICYGLKNSYVKGEIFEGSLALLYYADSIEEIKTVCEYCNKKATMNLRILNGEPIYSGNTIKCGDIERENDYYIPACREHYFRPNLF
jgi:thymidine kinase